MAKCTTFYVSRLILSQIFLYIAHGFPEIIPFPVQLPLKLLERNLFYQLLVPFEIIRRLQDQQLQCSAEKVLSKNMILK